MAEQIKVGVVLEFNGLTGLNKLPESVKTLLKGIQDDVASINTAIKFDSASLQNFAAQIQRLNAVVSELRALASQPIKVTVTIDNGSINTIADGFADAFVEALTKVRSSFSQFGGVIAEGITDSLKNSSTEIGKSIGNAISQSMLVGAVKAAEKAATVIADIPPVVEQVTAPAKKGRSKKKDENTLDMFSPKQAENVGEIIGENASETLDSAATKIGIEIANAAVEILKRESSVIGNNIAGGLSSLDADTIGTAIAAKVVSSISQSAETAAGAIATAMLAHVQNNNSAASDAIANQILEKMKTDASTAGDAIAASIFNEFSKKTDEIGNAIGLNAIGSMGDPNSVSKVAEGIASLIGVYIKTNAIGSSIAYSISNWLRSEQDAKPIGDVIGGKITSKIAEDSSTVADPIANQIADVLSASQNVEKIANALGNAAGEQIILGINANVEKLDDAIGNKIVAGMIAGLDQKTQDIEKVGDKIASSFYTSASQSADDIGKIMGNSLVDTLMAGGTKAIEKAVEKPAVVETAVAAVQNVPKAKTVGKGKKKDENTFDLFSSQNLEEVKKAADDAGDQLGESTIEKIDSNVEKIGKAIADAASKSFLDHANEIGEKIATAISTFNGLPTAVAEGIIVDVVNKAARAGDAIAEAIVARIAAAPGQPGEAIGNSIIDKMVNAASTAGDSIGSSIATALAAADSANKISDSIGGAIASKIGASGTDAGNGIAESAVTKLKELIASNSDDLGGKVGEQIATKTRDAGFNIANSFANSLEVANVKSKIEAAGAKIALAFASSQELSKVGAAILTGLESAIKESTTVGDKIGQNAAQVLEQRMGAVGDIIGSSMIARVLQEDDNLGDKIGAAIVAAINVSNLGPGIAQSIITGLNNGAVAPGKKIAEAIVTEMKSGEDKLGKIFGNTAVSTIKNHEHKLGNDLAEKAFPLMKFRSEKIGAEVGSRAVAAMNQAQEKVGTDIGNRAVAILNQANIGNTIGTNAVTKLTGAAETIADTIGTSVAQKVASSFEGSSESMGNAISRSLVAALRKEFKTIGQGIGTEFATKIKADAVETGSAIGATAAKAIEDIADDAGNKIGAKLVDSTMKSSDNIGEGIAKKAVAKLKDAEDKIGLDIGRRAVAQMKSAENTVGARIGGKALEVFKAGEETFGKKFGDNIVTSITEAETKLGTELGRAAALAIFKAEQRLGTVIGNRAHNAFRTGEFKLGEEIGQTISSHLANAQSSVGSGISDELIQSLNNRAPSVGKLIASNFSSSIKKAEENLGTSIGNAVAIAIKNKETNVGNVIGERAISAMKKAETTVGTAMGISFVATINQAEQTLGVDMGRNAVEELAKMADNIGLTIGRKAIQAMVGEKAPAKSKKGSADQLSLVDQDDASADKTAKRARSAAAKIAAATSEAATSALDSNITKFGKAIGGNAADLLVQSAELIGAGIGNKAIEKLNAATDKMGKDIALALAKQVKEDAKQVGTSVGTEIAAQIFQSLQQKTDTIGNDIAKQFGDQVAQDKKNLGESIGSSTAAKAAEILNQKMEKLGTDIAKAFTAQATEDRKVLGNLIGAQIFNRFKANIGSAGTILGLEVAKSIAENAAVAAKAINAAMLTPLENKADNIGEAIGRSAVKIINRDIKELTVSFTGRRQPSAQAIASAMPEGAEGQAAAGNIEDMLNMLAQSVGKKGSGKINKAAQMIGESADNLEEEQIDMLEEIAEGAQKAAGIGNRVAIFSRKMFENLDEMRTRMKDFVGVEKNIPTSNEMLAVGKVAEEDIGRGLRRAAGFLSEMSVELESLRKTIVSEEASLATAEDTTTVSYKARSKALEATKLQYELERQNFEVAREYTGEISRQYELIKQRNKMLEDTGKVDVTSNELNNELKSALSSNVGSIVDLMKQEAGNLFDSQVRQVDTFNLRLANVRRVTGRAGFNVSGQISQTKNRMGEIEQEIVSKRQNLEDPNISEADYSKTIRELVILEDQYASQGKELERLTDRYSALQKQTKKIGDFSSQFKSATNVFRIFARTAEEPNRIIERTGRTAERLQSRFQSLSSTLNSLQGQFGERLEIGATDLGEGGIIQAQKFIEDRRKQIEDNQKNIQDQMTMMDAFEKQVLAAAKNASTGKTMFAFNEEDPQAQERVDAEAQSMIEAYRSRAGKYISELQDEVTQLVAVGNTDFFKNLSASVQQSGVFDKLKTKIRDVGLEVTTLNSRSIRLGVETELGGSSARSDRSIDVELESQKMIQAQKDFDKTAKRIEEYRNELLKLEQQGFDTSEFVDQLREAERALAESATGFKVYGKALQDVSETRAAVGRIDSLSNNLKQLNGQFGASTDQLSEFAKEIVSLEKEIEGLDQNISELESEYKRLVGSNDNAAQATKQALMELQRLREAAKGKLFGEDFARNQDLILMSENLDKARQGIIELGRSSARMNQDLKRASSQLTSLVPEDQLQAVDTFKRIGNEARASVQEINDYIFSIQQAASRTGGLTDAQKAQIAQLEQMRGQFEQTAGQIKRNSLELDMVGRRAEKAGQGFKLYSAELANSVMESLKFVEAATIVGSVIGGVRTVFDSMIESSKQFARTMTVLQSNSMNLTQIYAKLKKEATDTAIAFGTSVEETSEVLKQFGSAGLSAEEAFSALNPTMKLLTSTNADAEEVARSMAGIYNVFGSEMKKTKTEMQALESIADVLAVTYRDHQAELPEMVQGLKFVGSSAKLAGFSFEDTATYLAVLNDNLLKSGMAGRGLNAVFAQIAAKSDQMGKVFNFEFNPDMSIADQFIPFLRHVNEQVAAGIISASALADQFKFFDRQGARAFQTLVTQFPKVEKGLDNMRNKSKGVTDELSNIIRSDFAAQFERGKQAALAFGRSFLEPLKPAMIAIADVVVSMKELSDRFPGFAKWTGIIVGFVAALVLVVTTVRSVAVVLGVMTDSAIRSVIGFGSSARSAFAAAASFRNLGRTAATTTTQVNALNAAMGQNAATSGASAAGGLLTLGKSASRLAGGFGVIITVVLTLVPLLASLFDTSAEVNREFEQISASLSELGREQDALNQFTQKIKDISLVAQQSGTSVEVVGQQIRDAYNEAGDNVANYAIIAGKTNKQLGEQAREIIARTNEQIAVEKKLQEEKAKTEKTRGQSAFGRGLIASIDTEGINEAADSYFKALKQENLIDPWRQNYKGFLSEEIPKELIKSSDLKKASQKFNVEADKILVNARNQIADSLSKGYYSSLKEATDAAIRVLQVSNLDSNIIQYLTAELLSLEDQTKKVQIAFKSFDEVDNFEATFGAFNKAVSASSKVGASTAFFDAQIDKAIYYNNVLKDTDDEIARVTASLNTAAEIDLPSKVISFDNFNEFKIGVDRTYLEDTIKDAYKQAGREGIIPDLSNLFFDDKIDPFGNSVVNMQKLAEVAEKLGQSIGQTPKQQRELTAEILKSATAQTKLLNAAKLTADATESNFKMVEAQARVQLILNDRQKAGAEITQTQLERQQKIGELAEALGDAGLDQNRAQEIAQARINQGLDAEANARRAISDLQKAQVSGSAVTPENTTAREKAIKILTNIIELRIKEQALDQARKINDKDRLKNNEIALENITQTLNNYKGQVAILRSQQRITQVTNKLNIDFLKESGKLVQGNNADNYEGLNQLYQMYDELLKQRQGFQQAYVDENVAAFQTLSTIEKMLNPKNPMAGFRESYRAILIEIDNIVESTKTLTDLNGQNDISDSQKIKRSKDLVEKLGEILELEKQFKDFRKESAEKEKEINKYVEDRLSAYKEVNSLLSSQVDQGQRILEEAIKRQFDIDQMARGESFFGRANQVAEKLAAIFKTNATDVQMNIDMYIKAYADLLRQGKIESPIDFGGAADQATELFGKVNKARKDLSDSLIKARDAELNLARANFQQALERAKGPNATAEDIKQAQEAAEKFKTVMQQLKDPGEDGIVDTDAFALATSEFVNMLRALEGLESKNLLDLNIKIRGLGIDEGQLEILKQRIETELKKIKVDLNKIFIVGEGYNIATPTSEVGDAGYNFGANLQNAMLGNIKSGVELRRNSEAIDGNIRALRENELQLIELGKIIQEFGGKIPTTEFDMSRSPILDVEDPSPSTKKATGGPIYGPGTKNSDSILAALSTGEYVVRADAVSHYGVEYLNALNSKRLGKFQAGGVVGHTVSQAKTELKTADRDSGNLIKEMSGLTDAVRQLVDLQMKAKQATEPEVKDTKVKEGRESGVFKFFDQLGTAIQEISSTIFASLQNVLSLEFVAENIAALQKYNDEVAKIGETFEEQIDDIESALKRNESSYFDYLNSLQDAEQERIKSLIEAEKQYQEELKTTRETATETFNSLLTGLTDLGQSGIASITDKYTQKFMDEFAAAEGFGPSAGNLAVAGGIAAGGALVGGAVGMVGDLVSLAGQDPEEVSKFIDQFIEELPAIAENLINNIVENLPKLIEALAEMMPVLFTTIAEALPDLIMMLANQLPILVTSFLDALINALPDIAKALIKGIVVAVPKIIAALLDALGTLMLILPELLIDLVVGFVEGLFELLTSPDFWVNLGKAILKMFLFPVTGLLKMFGIDIFHEGGVIPGRANDVPIIAQGGEGVLSRQGMLALGGAQTLDKLNQGINPFLDDINRYHSGGVVGESMTRDAVIDRRPSMANNNINTSNNVSVNVSVSGNMSQAQMDQMTTRLVNDIDNKLAKKVQDRDSRLARSISRK